MSFIAAAIGTAVLGIGVSAYSAKKQSDAADDARANAEAARIAAQKEAKRIEEASIQQAADAKAQAEKFAVIAETEAQAASERALRDAKLASDAALENAAEIERVTKREQDYQKSLARARSASSGVSDAGTTSIYLEAMEQAASEEIDWIRKVGESQSSLQLAAGESTSENILASGRGTTEASLARGREAVTSILASGKSQSYAIRTQGESIYASGINTANASLAGAWSSLGSAASSLGSAALLANKL